MIFREATLADIPQIQRVRNAVTENTLSDPNLVTDADCALFLCVRGKGWVCEIADEIVGFAIADLQENNIWALFIAPAYAQRGIGKKLHQIMLDWYFAQQKEAVWLSTSPHTRAEIFYRKQGWREAGVYGKGEIRFEMTRQAWEEMRTTR